MLTLAGSVRMTTTGCYLSSHSVVTRAAMTG
jgi:hypothetical protein